MTIECKVCSSDVEPNAQFCGECGSSKDDATSGMTCCRCRVNLPLDRKKYVLRERSGCLVDDYEYCKECYKAKLSERAKWNEIENEARKTAGARCNECKKPFTGFFRKKRFAVAAPWDLTTDYYCEDCYLALPKNEKLDDSNDFDPWL